MTKRRQPQTPSREAEHRPLKRSKRLQDSQRTSEKPSNIPSHSQASWCSQSYPIGAVIAERSDEYLIDCANNPTSRQSYSPSWQPKGNVAPEAVRIWKRSSKPVKQHTRTNVRNRGLSNTVHIIGAAFRSNTTLPHSEIVHTCTERSKSHSKEKYSEKQSYGSPAEPLRVPPRTNLLVSISQHSSFDRDQYLQYHSSLSSPSFLSSLPPHQDSGLGESSPLSETLGSGNSLQIREVKDSQSIPGSSSYVPTSSGEDTSFRISLSTGQSSSAYQSTSFDQYTGLLTEDEQSYCDTSGDSSRFFVAESPEYASRFRRSRSLPTQSTIELSPSGVEQATPSSALFPNHFIPGLLLSNAADAVNDLLDETQQQVHTPYLSQKDFPTHTQHPTSRATEASIPRTLTQALARTLTASQSRHRTTSTSFVILEDFVADGQPTQTTESAVLSQRDPNSQTDRASHSSRFRNKDDSRKPSSSSLDFAPPPDLSILNSKTPPEPPAFSMSQHSATDLDTTLRTSSEIPGSGLRAKLKKLREGSKTEADGRRLNRRGSEQAHSPGVVNDSAVCSNASHPPSLSGSPSAMDEGFNGRNVKSLFGARTPSASMGPATPLPAVPPFSKEFATTLSTQPLNSSNGHGVIPSQDQVPPGQSRIETQRSDVLTNVPLPLHVTEPSNLTSVSSSGPTPSQDISSVSQVVTSLQPAYLGHMEFVVPLGMKSSVRDQYFRIMSHYRKSIDNSLEDRLSNEVSDQIRLMVDRLNCVTTHLDLDTGDDNSQGDVLANHLAMWAENCSEKFKFLHHLLKALRDRNVHLAIVAKPGQLLDILETFLKGNNVAYNRPDVLRKSEPKRNISRLEVTLLPSGVKGSTILPGGAHLVVALDGSFNAQDPQVSKLRTHITNVGQLAPVVHLLVYGSVEHIERCISTTLDPIDRIRRIISCLTQVGDQVGQLLPDEAPASMVAEEVAAFVEAGGKEWTFPSIRAIEQIVSLEYSQGSKAMNQPVTTTERRVVAPSAALKRALNPDEASDSPGKRQRTTPAAEVTHISDSAIQDSQRSMSDLRTTLQEAKAEIDSLKTSHTRREKFLQASIDTTNNELQEHKEALSAMQDRYEQRTRLLTTLRQERDALTAAATASERKREANAAEIIAVKESRSRLEDELRQARDMLSASTIPGIADIERANAEVRRLQAQNTESAKRLASMKTDFDFTRTAYQNASNAAADSAATTSSLESEVAELRAKASSVAVELAEKNKRNENEMLRKHLTTAEAMLADREEILRRKEDEIKELRRGRGLGTRGSSVLPGGSPRGSRGASPVAGEAMLRVGSKGLGSGLRYGTKGPGSRGGGADEEA